MNHDTFERIFDGGYPWPNWDELRRQKASPDPNEAEAARTVEQAIEVAAEWLEAHTQAFAWTPEKEAEFRQALISRCPGCSERLRDAIRKYITWYGWHEGMLQFPNHE
jgi:hypothetical protein